MRILLAEDNPVNQKVVSIMLERRGHEVTVAENGKRAVELYQDGAFDLMFMDIQMPEMDGYEALASIRMLEQKSGTRMPIIALTAHAMNGEQERCRMADFDGYLTKPLRQAELDAALEPIENHTVCNSQSPSVSRFDRACALEQVGGDEGLLQELIELFLNRAPGQLASVREAFERGDGNAAQRSAHTLKGSVSVFVAPEAIVPIQELEQLSKAGRIGEAKERFAVVQSLLDELCAEMSAGVPGPA
jgi:CheY-like chemotaxis protein